MKKKPSWRVCPKCKGRATKIYNVSTGQYKCQQCKHLYAPPQRQAINEEGPSGGDTPSAPTDAA